MFSVENIFIEQFAKLRRKSGGEVEEGGGELEESQHKAGGIKAASQAHVHVPVTP